MTHARFKKIIWDYYHKAGRHDLPWRNTRDPYRIMVSEVMLQQTQVSRVLKKYEEFLALFPTLESLAKSPVSKVLKAWQGLGYNRRALNLQRAAKVLVRDHKGIFPRTLEALLELPGIGKATAGGILAYTYDIPTAFIETNIRSVYIHFFLPNQKNVSDKNLLSLIEATLPSDRTIRANCPVRDWYYALMDYGVHLKQTLPNPSQRSKHHTKQSAFKGSNREIRSKILKILLEEKKTRAEIFESVGKTTHDIDKNIRSLVSEGFIEESKGIFRATS
jgi:A/G-specific adenine glycosylase